MSKCTPTEHTRPNPDLYSHRARGRSASQVTMRSVRINSQKAMERHGRPVVMVTARERVRIRIVLTAYMLLLRAKSRFEVPGCCGIHFASLPTSSESTPEFWTCNYPFSHVHTLAVKHILLTSQTQFTYVRIYAVRAACSIRRGQRPT